MNFIIAITRGIIRDIRTRRVMMMAISLAALGMLFAGSVLISGWLAEHPLWFLFFWFVCGWLTLTSVLLALFDMLLVRAEGRRTRMELARKILGREDDEE